MKTKGWGLALTLTLALAVASTSMASASKKQLAHQFNAWDLATDDTRVYLLDEDFQHVRAVDPTTGKTLWRQKFQNKEPRGTHSLQLKKGRLFVHAGPLLVELNPQSGAKLGSLETVWNQPRCRFELRHGNLAEVECEQASWVLDLKRWKEIAQNSQSRYHLYPDLGQPPDTAWANIKLGVIGRQGRIAVAVTEDKRKGQRKGMFGEKTLVVGLDARTGKEVWHNDQLIRGSDWDAGVVEKTGKAWFSDHSNRTVGAFDLATGKIVWKRTLPSPADPYKNTRFVTWYSQGGLIVADHNTVQHFDPVTGKVGWSSAAPPQHDLVHIIGTPIDRWPYFPYPQPTHRHIHFVDPIHGQAVAKIKQTPTERVIPAEGGFALSDPAQDHARRFDTRGKLVETVANLPKGRHLDHISDHHLTFDHHPKEAFSVFERAAMTPVAEMTLTRFAFNTLRQDFHVVWDHADQTKPGSVFIINLPKPNPAP